jgi:hypothetical protein
MNALIRAEQYDAQRDPVSEGPHQDVLYRLLP